MIRDFRICIAFGVVALLAAIFSPTVGLSSHTVEFRLATTVPFDYHIEKLFDFAVAPEAIPAEPVTAVPHKSVVAFGYSIPSDTSKSTGRVEVARWLTIAPASRYSQRA